MATVSQQELAPLHKQLNLTINKEDYMPSFEKSLKEYSKNANIPGFRKGMVPAGLIRKMYGASLFTDEVLKTVDRELFKYMDAEKLDIFAQPLPLEMNLAQLDPSKPENYEFSFEVGMKPEFQLPNLPAQSPNRYKVEVTDAMINDQISRLQERFADVEPVETIQSEDNGLDLHISGDGIDKDVTVKLNEVKASARAEFMGKKADDIISANLNDLFEGEKLHQMQHELGSGHDANPSLQVQILKAHTMKAREMDENFYNQIFPNKELKTDEEFRNELRTAIQAQWEQESKNQLQHSIYHILLDNTHVNFPEPFLKRWLKTQGKDNTQKTDEEVEQEFPGFLQQLKWSLISDRLITENQLQVTQDDLRAFAKSQLLGYMGMSAMDEEQDWVKDYIDRILKDRKYVQDAHDKILTAKLMDWTESQVNAKETSISEDEFIKMTQEHNHVHH